MRMSIPVEAVAAAGLSLIPLGAAVHAVQNVYAGESVWWVGVGAVVAAGLSTAFFWGNIIPKVFAARTRECAVLLREWVGTLVASDGWIVDGIVRDGKQWRVVLIPKDETARPMSRLVDRLYFRMIYVPGDMRPAVVRTGDQVVHLLWSPTAVRWLGGCLEKAVKNGLIQL